MKNKDREMTIKEFKTKQEKLKTRYKSIGELQDHCDRVFGSGRILLGVIPNEALMIRPAALIEDSEDIHESRDIPLYKCKDNALIKMDTKKLIKALVKTLSAKVTVEKLIEDVLEDIGHYELEEVYERAIVKKGKIREEEGCYKLLIGGKRGVPHELMLRY